MHRKELKHVHGQKGEDRKSEMVVMLWEKLGDSEKKALMLRKLEGKIMKKEHTIKLLQHKVETLKTVKSSIEKI
jgi:methionine salvage enolase-phosphatase E1